MIRKTKIAVGLPALLVGIFLLFGIKIPLGLFEKQIEEIAGNSLNRQVDIAGDISVSLSINPKLEIKNLSIANPTGWADNRSMLNIREGRVQISLPSLFLGNIHIKLIEFFGLDLVLMTRADNSTNFAFEKSDESKGTGQVDPSPSFFVLSSVDELALHAIHLAYEDELSGKSYDFEIDSADGSARKNERLTFKLYGTIADLPVSIDIRGDQIQDLIQLQDLWSFSSGQFNVGNSAVSLTGAVGKDQDSMTGYLDVSIMGNDLLHLGQQFGIALPESDEFSLTGRFSLVPGAITATNIGVKVDQGELASDLLISLHGARPTVMGNVILENFSSLSFAAAGNEKEDKQKDASNSLSFFEQTLPYQFLEFVDADLHIHGSDIKVDRFEVTNADMVFSLVDGDLLLPLSIDFMGISIHSQLAIDTSEDQHNVSINGIVEKANLNRLLSTISSEQEMTGDLGKMVFAMESDGESPKTLIKNLLTDIYVEEIVINSDGAGDLFSANTLAITRPAGAPLTIDGNGQLLGKPFFSSMVFGTLKNETNTLDHGFSIDVEACDSAVKLEYHARVEDIPATMNFSLQGKDVCGMLKPFEQFFHGSSDFSLVGSAQLDNKRWELTFESIHIADFRGEGKTVLLSKDRGVPLLTVDLQSPDFDIRKYLEDGIEENSDSVERDDKTNGNSMDETADSTQANILSQEIISLLKREIPSLKILEKADVDIVLQIDELMLTHDSLTDFRFETHVKDGNIVSSPFSATFAKSTVSGDIKLDLETNTPICVLNFSLSNANLPEIFKSSGLLDAPEIEAENVSVMIRLEGNTLLEMIQKSSHEVSLKKGVWRIGADTIGNPLVAKIDSLIYQAKRDVPATVAISGSFKDEPITIDVKGEGLFAKGTGKPADLAVDVSAGDVKISVYGNVKRPPGSIKTYNFDTKITGTRLDKLNYLLNYNLPPFGPYEFHGALHTEENAVIIDDLTARVGESILNGDVIVKVQRDQNGKLVNPSHLHAKFKAKTLQLNDFSLEGWSPENSQPVNDKAPEKKKTEKTGEGLSNLFGEEFAKLLEVQLEIIVEEVLSGADNLGKGYLTANNFGGKNSLEALHLEIPGGKIEVEGSYFQGKENHETDLHLKMDHFDYGILVRRTSPESKAKGVMNVRVDLSSQANISSRLTEHLNGKLRVGVIPEDLKSGVIDLWAVNILSAALPAIMKGSESEINCLAGDFTFDDGIITPEVFLLDTSKMRVNGDGTVNLKNGTIDFKMKPTPKSPQYFSIATPVSISGTIRDFNIGVSAGGVVGSVFRIVSGVLTVPLQKLFSENMEPDGAKACSAAMSWVADPVVQ